MTPELDIRPPDAGTPADVPTCSVVVPVPLSELLPGWLVDGYSLERCGEPAAGRYAGQCPCGHVRDGWLCAGHVEQLAEGCCRACIEDPVRPHECPLPVERLEVPGGQ